MQCVAYALVSCGRCATTDGQRSSYAKDCQREPALIATAGSEVDDVSTSGVGGSGVGNLSVSDLAIGSSGAQAGASAPGSLHKGKDLCAWPRLLAAQRTQFKQDGTEIVCVFKSGFSQDLVYDPFASGYGCVAHDVPCFVIDARSLSAQSARRCNCFTAPGVLPIMSATCSTDKSATTRSAKTSR